MRIVSDPGSRGKGFVTARPGGTSGTRRRGEEMQGSIRGPIISRVRNAPTPLGPLAFFWLRGGCVPCYRITSVATRTPIDPDNAIEPQRTQRTQRILSYFSVWGADISEGPEDSG